MKTTKILITSLLAAAAMGANAFADVTIADGQTTTITAGGDVGAVTIGAGSTYQLNIGAKGTWSISSLNGTTEDTYTSGSLVYLNRTNTGTWSATLQLSGDNDFAGTIKVTNTSSGSVPAIGDASGHANAVIVLNSVGAAKNATVCVGGDGSNGATSATHAQERLVVGVDGAKVAGLTGVVPKATVISRGNMGTWPTNGYFDNNTGTYDSSDTTVRTLELTGLGTYTFAGVIEQNVSLNKTGSGTQTFSGEVNSGVVSLSAGTLVFSGTANIANSLTVTGGTLDLSAGTTTFGGALTLSGGSVTIGRLGDGENAVVAAAGVVTISDSVGVTLAGAAKNGTFAIFSGNTLSNTGTLTLSATNSGFEQTWTTNGNVTYVTISGAANSNLVWAGGTDSWTWNTSDEKWKLFGSETASAFTSGDDVKFATSGAQISLNSAVSAGAITIAADTTFSGTADKLLEASGGITILDGATLTAERAVWNQGKITGGIKLDGADAKLILVGNTALLGNAVSGTGTLVFNQTNTSSSLVINGASLLQGGISVEKTGEGTLSLENSYSYTGGTKLTEGILQVKNNSALGSGTLTLNGGTLQAGAAHTLANAVKVAADSEVNTQTYTLTLNGAISGTGTLTKAGAGTLALVNPTASSVSGAGGIVVEAGTLYLNGGSGNHFGVSKDITLKDGTFLKWNDASQSSDASYQYELSGALAVEGNTTITGATNYAKEVALLGNLSGSGTLTYYRGNGDNNFNSNGRLIIAGEDNSGFKGTIVIGGQTTAVSQGLDLNADLANGTISLQGGSGQAAYMRVLKSATIKGLNGNANSSVGIGNVLQGGEVGAYTLTVGEGNFAGTIEDNGEARKYGSTTSTKVTGAVLSIVKNTAGTLTLSGNNTFSGGVTIEQGVLAAANAAALGNANNSVKLSGGQLKVSGVTLNQTAITVVLGEAYNKTNGGVVAALVGESGRLAAGTTVTVTVDASDLSALGLVAGVANEYSIWDASLETSGATLELSEAFESMLAAAGWTSSISGGTLTITAIPEPSVFGLLAGLGALALAGTRRRRRKA